MGRGRRHVSHRLRLFAEDRFPEFFEANPDIQNPRFQTRNGIYEEGCGLGAVTLSWGHDEYIYHVCKEYLPIEALYMLRYHSFYPWHREGAYGHLLNDQDREQSQVGPGV